MKGEIVTKVLNLFNYIDRTGCEINVEYICEAW